MVTSRPIGKSDELPLIPALAIPVVNKQEYECPKLHLEVLDSCLPQITKLLVVGWRAVQRIRDLLSGAALVRNDLLQRSWSARYGTGKYGNFAQLGRLSLTSRDYVHRAPGQRYRVTYSPASNIAWSLESPE